MNECVPEIQVQKVYVPLPSDLTTVHESPEIPSHGDNATLLDWAMQCGSTLRLYDQQMRAIKELEAKRDGS